MKTQAVWTCTLWLTVLAVSAGGQTPPPAEAPATSETQPATPEPISVAIKDMSLEQVGSFLSEKLGKPVLVADEVKGKKITIINKKPLPLNEALFLIRQAMLTQDAVVEEGDTLIRIRPVSDILRMPLRRIPADQPVSTVKDKLLVVVKEFRIRHYSVKNMVAALKPMLASYGYILADPDTRTIAITDTVANLERLEQIIQSMDVPMADQTATKIIEVKHQDASEIIAILRWLIAGRMGLPAKDITTARGEQAGKPSGPSPRQMPPGMMPPNMPSPGGPQPAGKSDQAEAGVTEIEPSKTPITLWPHISRNWIIATAPAEMMPQIEAWVRELDKPREVKKDYELLDVEFADVDRVSERIQHTLQSMPSAELRETTYVVPFAQANKIIVFGAPRGRRLVKELLEKLDVEGADHRIMETFSLQHADAEEMADRIELLFSNMDVDYKASWGTSYRRDPSAVKVSVVADKRRNSITVITDAKTMEKVRDLLKKEDKPIDPNVVKPKVYTLKYVDPGEMRDLLSAMFTARESKSNLPWWWPQSQEKEIKPVGRLLGQFTFQVLPSSGRLIVNSKSAGNYQVIDKLIAELDRPPEAGLPSIIELKYANAEDLCEQLNAILSEPGTLAKIRRAERGLTSNRRSSLPRNENNQNQSSENSNNQANQQSAPEEMPFWWQNYRRPADVVPSSNLIGKIRIVPVYQRNALMVLSPEAYKKPIHNLIEELDQLSRQVMIKARVGEIQHDGQTTLGLRIAADPALLTQRDTAIGGAAQSDFSDTYARVFGGVLTLETQASVNALLNLLIREFDMKVLLAPTLTTSDNQASEYFDGQDVPVLAEGRTSAEGTSTVTNIVYEEVGTRLRIRPHITKEGSVDLQINLEVSRIVPGQTYFDNPVFDRREVTTHVVLKSGQTIMISGIIQQVDYDDVRKWPLLGDLPGIGKFFRHVDKQKQNREMIMFVTPQVVNTPEQLKEQMKQPNEVLQRVEEVFLPEVQEPPALPELPEPPLSSIAPDGLDDRKAPEAAPVQDAATPQPRKHEFVGPPAPPSKKDSESSDSAPAPVKRTPEPTAWTPEPFVQVSAGGAL
ncbi:MAG: hypothetical protein JW849_07370 [Phycisphaerae bacterium]|nr:hypothetical protein [Phycisphaerae bacterium]